MHLFAIWGVSHWLSQLKEKGGKYCRITPYGYDLSEDGNDFVKNKKEQKVISQMMHMRLEGFPFQATCDFLNSKKIKSKSGKTWGKKNGLSDHRETRIGAGDRLTIHQRPHQNSIYTEGNCSIAEITRSNVRRLVRGSPFSSVISAGIHIELLPHPSWPLP